MEPALRSPLFTTQVVKAMQSLYPEELADRAWDNVGLLQENINPASGTVPRRVLLTNDLTLHVAEEAIKKQASVIVSYRRNSHHTISHAPINHPSADPFIFRGLKSLTLADPHQRIVLRLAQHNIAVYSPHTAVDAVLGGVNDWLGSILNKLPGNPILPDVVVQPIKGPVPAGFEGAGYGRRIELNYATDLASIARVYGAELGLKHVMVVRPRTADADASIRTVAVCAGSGYSVLKDVDADLIITGEMSHHDALRLKMLGKCVLTLFHSNSERGFLKAVLQPQLEEVLGVLGRTEGGVEVLVSEEDADPFEIWEAEVGGA